MTSCDITWSPPSWIRHLGLHYFFQKLQKWRKLMKTLSKMKMDCKKGTYFTMMLPTTGNKEEFCQKRRNLAWRACQISVLLNQMTWRNSWHIKTSARDEWIASFSIDRINLLYGVSLLQSCQYWTRLTESTSLQSSWCDMWLSRSSCELWKFSCKMFRWCYPHGSSCY